MKLGHSFLSLLSLRFRIVLLGILALTGLSPSALLAEDCISFNPDQSEVRLLGGRWKVVSGNGILLDFGGARAEADQALEVIQHYGLDSQCFVGRPGPSLEYYLVVGPAPRGAMAGEDSVPFDPARLEILRINGSWKIVEGSHWLLDFGGNLAEAQTSLSIIRNYQFTRMCFVGRPDPSMVYFRTDCAGPSLSSVSLASRELTINGPRVQYEASFGDDCGLPVDAVLQTWIEQGETRRAAGGRVITCEAGDSCSEDFTIGASDEAPTAGSGEFVPGRAIAVFELKVDGQVVSSRRVAVTLYEEEDCVSFDYRRVRVQSIGGSWKIVEGNHLLMDFGANRGEAVEALRIIRHYRMDSMCFVGRPDPSMQYFLVDGEAPRGPYAGEDAIPFNPERLQVRNVGGRWKVAEGDHLLLDFDQNVGEARAALRIIRNYGFNRICFVGRPDASMTYFRIAEESEVAPSFVRGDTNGSGLVDVNDVVVLSNYVLQGDKDGVSCLKALDVNDDGRVDSNDTVHLGGFLFASSAPPAAPFPGCGIDPTADRLPCEAQCD